MTSRHTKLLIIGSGPAGLAAAACVRVVCAADPQRPARVYTRTRTRLPRRQAPAPLQDLDLRHDAAARPEAVANLLDRQPRRLPRVLRRQRFCQDGARHSGTPKNWP